MFGQHKLAKFVVKVFILILIFASFWPFVAPGYSTILAAATNLLAGPTMRIEAEGSLLLLYSGAQLQPLTLHSLPFQAGMLLLLALVIATPGPSIKQRLIFAVAAIVLTFALHTGSLVIMSTREPAMRPILVLVASVGFYLFPVVIWAAFIAIFRRKQTKAPAEGTKEKHEGSTLLLGASEQNR